MTATTPCRSAPRALRPLALLVVLLTLSAQVAGLAHMVLVRHVACPEHGEGHLHPGEDASAHERAAGSVTEPGAERGGAATAVEHHDHCAIAAHRREQVAVPGGSPGSSPALDPPAARDAALGIAPANEARAPSFALFRLAPKTSPPV